MVVVINLETHGENKLIPVLEKLGCAYKVSQSEQDICNADKIILSADSDIKKFIRNLHIHNLFNLLRIIKKPFLCVGSAMQLLCEKVNKDSSAGLGIIKKENNEDETVPEEENPAGLKKIKILNKDHLFKGFDDEEEFYFENQSNIPKSDCTSAVPISGIECSVAYEDGNYYGVQFLPELSNENGVRVIKNFLEIE